METNSGMPNMNQGNQEILNNPVAGTNVTIPPAGTPTNSAVSVPVPAKRNFREAARNIFKKPLFKKIGIAVVVVCLLIAGAFFVGFKNQSEKLASSYRLVPEKISKSASIRISLPKGVDKEIAKKGVVFDPQLQGSWVTEGNLATAFLAQAYAAAVDDEVNSNIIVFKPAQPLNLNRHYAVKVDLGDSKVIQADFLAVDDPQISAIFPSNGSETLEDDKITIVFSRPMIPLTTLEQNDARNIPIDITPKTEGKFKWISTNTLQFTPKDRLQRSSNYTVKINPGMVSMDGLSVGGSETKFVTRLLRYSNPNNESGQVMVYNQPIRIYFNQGVDLDKTLNEIKLYNVSNGKQEIPFVAQYKKTGSGSTGNIGSNIKVAYPSGKFSISKYFNYVTASVANNIAMLSGSLQGSLESVMGNLGIVNNVGNADKSVIEIYPQKDKFNRSKLWDFETGYEVAINKAYPEEGDVSLNQAKTIDFSTTGIVSGYDAVSGRSDYDSLEMFDPQGQLSISFYEPINISKSSIKASVNIEKIEYGEKCANGNSLSDPSCQKTDNRQVVKIKFNPSGINPGQKISVNLEKIVNDDGLKINAQPINVDLYVYKAFDFRLEKYGLDYLAICSNTPLLIPEKADFKNRIKADLDYDVFSWGSSWKVSYIRSEANKICELGEFETYITVGLMPESNYQFTFNLTDEFDQNSGKTVSVTTGKMESDKVNLFTMQKDYSVTTPQKTKLGFGAQNLDYVTLQICKLSPLDLYSEYYDNYDYYWSNSTVSLGSCTTIERDTINLPKRYWVNNYFDVNIADYFADPIGNYIVVLSNPLFKNYNGDQRKIYSFVTITNLAAAEKNINPSTYNSSDESPLTDSQLNDLKNIYWVTDINSQNPVTDAKVSLYTNPNHSLIFKGSGQTNSDGLALMKPVAGVSLAVVEKGNDSTIVMGDDNLNYASSASNIKKIYLYTDKPLYRPGSTVDVKGIMRLGYDGNYQTFSGTPATVTVYDSQYNEILTKEVTLTEFGTFSFDFPLAADAPLGSYRYCVENTYSCGYFNVQEYVPAAFEIKTTTAKDEFISKDEVKINLDTNYYFGVPVSNADVEYTVSSQNYYFDKYTGSGYYNFGNFYDYYYDYSYGDYSYGDKFISRGKTTLDINGKGVISQNIDLKELFKNQEQVTSKIIVVDITVKNSLGQSVSTQKSFILHAGEFYLGVDTDPSFVTKNQNFALKVKSVNTDGKDMKVNNITANIYKTDWVYAKRQEAGGAYDYVWEKKRDFVKKVSFSTDNNGNYNNNLNLSDAGEYEIDVSAADSHGNNVFTRGYVYVYGSDRISVQMNSDNSLVMKAEKTDLKPGEQGELIIESPYKQAKALIAIERGKIFDYKIVDVAGSLYSYKFNVTEEYAPNVFVSVLLQSSDPDVKFGMQEFKIDSGKNKINIDVKPDKQSYSPGEEVVLQVKTTDYKNNPVSAEISTAVVDLSVLALEGNPKKDPVVFFYDGFPLTVSTSSNIKSALVKIEPTTDTKGGSGGGGGNDSAEKPRGEFKETAFWSGNVVTNGNGDAQIKFTLPDNLTTWQAEVLGVTKDTKLGVSYSQFMSKKDLMVVPFKPRFLVPGDHTFVGAQIFNQSNEKKDMDVNFKSETLKFLGNNAQTRISIKAGESKTVYYEVKAPENITKGQHFFEINANAGNGISDGVRLGIPIVPNMTYEVTATSNYTANDSTREIVYLPQNVSPEAGELTVKSSATLAVFLSNALSYLVQYPYGCSEQISSQLKSMAIVKGGLNIPNLEDKFKLDKVYNYQDKKYYSLDELFPIGLASIYNNQSSNGGFGLWNSQRPNYYTTLRVLDMLTTLKENGIAINEDSMNRAADYAYGELNKLTYTQSPGEIIATASVLMKVDKYKNNGLFKQSVETIAKDDGLIKDKLSNKALAEMAVLMSSNKNFNKALATKLNTVLDNRINIDSRGAFLESNKNYWYFYYETTIADTALYLRSLALGQRDAKINDKVVRWLLNSKEKDGAWGSTQNTLSVVQAFVDYLRWKKETNASFTLDTVVNGQSVDKFAFNSKTIFDQLSNTIPISSLKIDNYNTIDFNKSNQGFGTQNSLYYDMSLKYYLTGNVAPRDEGFTATRNFYSLEDVNNKTPLTSAKVGDVFREHLQIIVPEDRRDVTLEDYIPAGIEIVNMDLATEQKSLRFSEGNIKDRTLYADFKELRDDRAFVYTDYLSPGVYEFDYYVRALVKGDYLQLPAIVSEMNNPENFGRTGSNHFTVD